MNPLASELVAGLFGAAAAAIPVWAIARRQPSRRVQDTVAIVDASGEVIEHLRQEMRDLRQEVAQARREADESKAKVAIVTEQADLLRRRVSHLEQAVRSLGGNPDTIVSSGK